MSFEYFIGALGIVLLINVDSPSTVNVWLKGIVPPVSVFEYMKT